MSEALPRTRTAWRPQAPGVAVLRNYQRGWLRPDAIAGITVAAYLVPQVMAYATIAGLPPVIGIYASIGPLVVYAFLGTSRQLSIGPESTTALLTATAIAPLAAGDPARYAVLAAALALTVAAFALIAWVARLGVAADLLSRPILVGYLTGVALTMIVSQLGRVTGVDVEGSGILDRLQSFAAGLSTVDAATLALAASVLVFLFAVRQVSATAPGPLLAVLAAAAAVVVFDLDDRFGITVVGPIPTSLPTPQWPGISIDDFSSLLLPAVGVLVVGFSDNVLTGRAFASRHSYRIEPNQELLALGAANAASGVLQGFPVSSSGSRTAIADSLGSRTQVASLITAASVVVVLLIGADILAAFPSAALGALVVYAAIRLIDVAEFRRLAAFRRSELVLAFLALLGVLLFDILVGVLVAIAMSVLDVLLRVARPHDAILGSVPGLAGLHDIDDFPEARTMPGLVVYRYDSPLFFANAEDFRRRALESAASDPDLRWLLLNTEAQSEIDITALDALEDLRVELDRAGVVLALARVKVELVELLDRSGFLDRIGREHVFPTLPTALEGYRRAMAADPTTSPTALAAPRPAPPEAPPRAEPNP